MDDKIIFLSGDDGYGEPEDDSEGKFNGAGGVDCEGLGHGVETNNAPHCHGYGTGIIRTGCGHWDGSG